VNPRFVHVVNPVKAGPSSHLGIAQPITFESIKVAQQFAAAFSLQVELCAVNFPEDDEIVPSFFGCRKHLHRSVLDVDTFSIARKLPLIKDILDCAASTSDADFIIYTNIDIGVLPNFYLSLDRIIGEGTDALMVTRRTLPKEYQATSELWRMYAEIGDAHPGDDCFVFRREAYGKYDLGDACIGVKYIARLLAFNVILHARRFEHFRNLHLTFHIGDDRIWHNDKWGDYTTHNERVLRRVVRQYREVGKLVGNPLVDRWIRKFGADPAPAAGSPGTASSAGKTRGARRWRWW
jgi:hypothetical protein